MDALRDRIRRRTIYTPNFQRIADLKERKILDSLDQLQEIRQQCSIETFGQMFMNSFSQRGTGGST
jgi:hypothetical protein